MLSKSLCYLGEIFCLIATLALVQPAVGATATATVSVTILPPAPRGAALTLSTERLDMRASDELTITNRSEGWREIEVRLLTTEALPEGCRLHYSPMKATLPPLGSQVVRLLVKADRKQLCAMEHRLIITEPETPLAPALEVAIIAGQI